MVEQLAQPALSSRISPPFSTSIALASRFKVALSSPPGWQMFCTPELLTYSYTKSETRKSYLEDNFEDITSAHVTGFPM